MSDRAFRAASVMAMMIGGLRLSAAEPSGIDFARDIRPILADNCFKCHGQDEGSREAGLRLDLSESAWKPAESGAKAVVPGHPQDSELLKRVTSTDDALRMPPENSGRKPLSPRQIELLTAWIRSGGEYAAHWAFRAPVRPVVPDVDESRSRVQNDVDRFIIAKYPVVQLEQSPEADRITLLRRLSLDVIGLPPTIAEVEAFLADQSPEAYARQVERLLASPHYGERWGRIWLDAARYADSDGFEKDKSRQMHFYRDYVVDAFNRDLPYDRFIIEQLAGDLLPHATQDQLVATGFLRNSMINEEGGVDPEQFRMDAMFDRMDAVGKTFLGLTIQCAQCHTHKYDPLTHQEYYGLFAFLNNDHESQSVVYTAAEQQTIASLRSEMNAVDERIRQEHPSWPEQLADWETTVRENQPEWTTLPLSHQGDNAQRYFEQSDGSIVALGYAPTKFAAVFRAETDAVGMTAVRLELLTDPNLPCGGPGRSFMGTCALSEISVEAVSKRDPQQKQVLKFTRATADYGNEERELEPNFDDRSKSRRVTGPVAYAIDGKDETAWGIDAGPGRRNQPRNAVFVPETPFGYEGGTILNVTLKQMHGGWNSDDHMNNNLGRFRMSITAAENPVADTVPQIARRAFTVPTEQRSAAQHSTVFAAWRDHQSELKPHQDAIEALWKQWPPGSSSLTLTAREMARETRLLQRGDFLKPKQAVPATVPAFLHPLNDSSAPANRLTFAEWVADRRSPTTARVAVNRVWQAYFGTGLVATPEDLGTQAETPSHPELLDWLAVEFMDRGWSWKHIHRLIVTSATYRQSSRVTPEAFERDQYNRYLARAPRLRVEGEIVRDIALAASGLLNPKVGGPSIYSPAPGFLFQPPNSYGPFTWTEETGPDRYRRGLYTFRRRSTPYPMLQAFDAPNGDFSCVRRARSNTPLQALTSLNETVFLESARALGLEALRNGGADDAARIAYAFRRCVSRPPTTDEQSELLRLLSAQRARFQQPEANPWQVATNDPAKPPALPEGTAPSDAAAWTLVARVLLNLDETVTKE